MFATLPRRFAQVPPFAVAAVLAVLLLAAPARVEAHPAPSDASLVSMLPVAVSVAAPVAILSAGAALAVVSVEASAAGTVLVLERASDGVRASVRLAGPAAYGASVVAGAAVTVTALSTGWILATSGEVIAFVPNEIGVALLHHERVTR